MGCLLQLPLKGDEPNGLQERFGGSIRAFIPILVAVLEVSTLNKPLQLFEVLGLWAQD